MVGRLWQMDIYVNIRKTLLNVLDDKWIYLYIIFINKVKLPKWPKIVSPIRQVSPPPTDKENDGAHFLLTGTKYAD
jgi:hypothetical protein